MAKGYWIARMDVKDAERYKDYVSGAAKAFGRYNMRFLVRGGAVHPMEGEARARNVVIEFDSVEDALACYNDPDYKLAAEIRQSVAEGELVIVEGYDG